MTINDGLVILNESKDVILANEAASLILGIPEKQLIGKNARELSLDNSVMRDLLDSLEFFPINCGTRSQELSSYIGEVSMKVTVYQNSGKKTKKKGRAD